MFEYDRRVELRDLQRPDRPADRQSDLPLAGAVTRTFDTPEFRGMTFLEVQTRSALNRVRGMPFEWSINLYRGCQHACSFCFARPTHSYLNLDTTTGFDTTVVVKVNLVEVLAAEVARSSWKGEQVALGTNTDPYQRAEGRYRLMPGVIRTLARSWTPFSILTKGTLITRDIPLLKAAAERVPVAAALSISTLDRAIWRQAEPGAPSPRARLDVVRRLNDAGIPTGVMLAPIMPGITDDPDALRELATAAVGAGATHVTPIPLHLRRGVKEAFWPWLTATRPELEATYAELYGPPGGKGRATLPDEVAGRMVDVVRDAFDAAWAERGGRPDPGAWQRRWRPPTAPAPQATGEQLSLLG